MTWMILILTIKSIFFAVKSFTPVSISSLLSNTTRKSIKKKARENLNSFVYLFAILPKNYEFLKKY